MGVIILIVPIMIHPIEMYVRNLKTSGKFYSFLLEALGYELYQEWEEGFSYKRQETYLVFVQAEAAGAITVSKSDSIIWFSQLKIGNRLMY